MFFHSKTTSKFIPQTVGSNGKPSCMIWIYFTKVINSSLASNESNCQHSLNIKTMKWLFGKCLIHISHLVKTKEVLNNFYDSQHIYDNMDGLHRSIIREKLSPTNLESPTFLTNILKYFVCLKTCKTRRLTCIWDLGSNIFPTSTKHHDTQ